MDEIIISKENHILHICNQGYKVDYTIYNNKGHSLDGGVLESNKNEFENKKAISEIVSIIREQFSFSEPFIHLSGDKATNLLELIEMEDYKNTQLKESKNKSSVKNDSNIIDNEMEMTK